MSKAHTRWMYLTVLCLIAILILPGGSLPARAESGSPAERLEQAWHNAQAAGSYRFISDINQTYVPRPAPEMIGQQETTLSMTIDGAVLLPDQAYSEMKVLSNQISTSVVMIRDGAQTFMLQDGELTQVDDALNLASQSSDLLGYLSAADQVTLLDPPEGHPELARYGFVVDGPRYAEYIRQQAQAAMQAEPGAPEGLTLQPMPTLQQISGRGELWVNQDSLPVRQVLDLNMPQVNQQYGASIHMRVDLSSYGMVASIPQAVQGPDSTWQLVGTLTGGATPGLGAFPGFGTQSAQAVAGSPASPATIAGWWSHLISLLPVRVSSISVILLVVILLVLLFIRFYRRNPKHCYALIAFILIPIMVFSPVLQSTGVVRFMERQAQAAEASAAAVPDLLHVLGLNMEASEVKSGSPAAATNESSNQAGATKDSAALSPQAVLDQVASRKPKGAPVYDGVIQTTSNQGEAALGTCGYGELGVDTDDDGLTDLVENCLGTVAENPDTDSDLIPDGEEVIGFDYGGKHWDSDPLNADSNRDGITDTKEWPSTLTPKGQATNLDLDNDGLPNIWDDDDDGDGVPDAFDLSPEALTGYTTEFNLSSQGRLSPGSSGTEAIEIEIQPQDLNHLRYSTTLLDWPSDQEGNVQNLDNSTEDLRLAPFLLVTTNLKPNDDLLAQYGARAWYDEEQGSYVLLVTLQPLEDGGAVYAFYGKVAYAAADLTQDFQWNARVVWMAQMQQDSYVCHPDYYRGQVCDIETTPIILHQYQETFRLAGLQVTRSEGYEAAVIGTPGYAADDLYLFKLLIGLNNTFQSYQALEGQTDETALDELYDRFTNGDTLTHTFGIPTGSEGVINMTEPQDYPNAEAGLADTSNTVLPNFLDSYPVYSSGALCQDGDGNPVTCASLVLVSENHVGTWNLSKLRGADPRMVALDQFNVNLANVPVFGARNSNLRMYEKNSVTNAWQTMTPARMLEMVESRYHDAYASMLSTLYPNLQTQEARFIAYTGYLWAYGGLFNAISMDGQALAPGLADEQAAALASVVDDAFATNGLNYIGLATNLPSVLSDTFNTGQGIYQVIDVVLKRATLSSSEIGGKITLSAFGIAATLASIIMDSLSTVCATNPDLKMCAHETAFLVANLLVGTLNIGVQVVALAIQIAEAVIKELEGAIREVDVAGCVTGIIGAAVGIAMVWVAFGIIAGKTSDPVAWRMSLASAIVTTVWLIVLAIINFIPVIGPIITAILGFIDYVLGLITNLFGKKQWSLAQVILEFFYSAATDTSVESATFGEFSSGLTNMDMGLVEGNTFRFSVPVSGVINREDRGDDDDMRDSYVKGELQAEQDPSNPQSNPLVGTAMNEDVDCPISGDKAYCSNTAAVGFTLEPTINGTATFVARILYQTVWEEDMLYGAIEVKHHYPTGQFPEEGDLTYNTVTLDVLPATVTDLWSWSALDNPDRDGDGLTNDEEQALGTDPDQWDTDSDSLSDWYEVEMCSQQGCDPLKTDTDSDGLNDALERRAGTRINQADSDGDGLSDSDELRHVENGELVGGWNVTINPPGALSTTADPTSGSHPLKLASSVEAAQLASDNSYWVSSDPLLRDDDGDSLNAYEEMHNGLSPQATNALVPQLILNVSPVGDIPDARPGAYWLPGQEVALDIHMANFATGPVDNTLTLTLPYWLGTISGGFMQGDRQPPMVQTDNTLTWDFSGSNALQLYETVSTTINAQVNPEISSGSDEIDLDLLYGSTQLHKMLRTTVDGDNPAVTIMAPSDGAYLSGTSFVVGGSTTDPTTWITERSLSIVSQGEDARFEALPAGQGIWAYTWDLPTTDGLYTLRAQATDAMNHATATGDVVVTVDNTPPEASLAYEMDNGAVHLSGEATDNLAGVQWVQLMVDGQPWRNVPLNATGWSFDWTVDERAQGEHTVSVRAIDYSRNQSDIVTQTITVDSVPPSSVVTAGADPHIPPAIQPETPFDISGVANEGGHLPQPATQVNMQTGMDTFDDSTVWLGLSTIHDNDNGVLAAWIGDFNADRLSDLAVGMPGPEGDAGQVAILYGRAGGWPVPPDLEMLATSLTSYTGPQGAGLGSLVAAAGDANADGLDDLLVAGRNSTDAYLIFGNPNPLGKVTLHAGQSGYRVLLRAPEALTGLAAAGDVNGDGFGDLLIQTGGTAFLVLGRGNPWPETIDIARDAVANFTGVAGALGVGDVDNDQLAEWVTRSSGTINLYDWNNTNPTKTFNPSDTDPRAVALGDVDGDQSADWLYSNGINRILVYGSGGPAHLFTGFDGFFAAPGDVDGDGRADILLTDASGMASLIGQAEGGSPAVLATIAGVGGAANAPYATGADLNADGSADLLLIPSQRAAEARGFDAPDFSSGFVSPQTLPLGVSSVNQTLDGQPVAKISYQPQVFNALGLAGESILALTNPDTFYVDDDGGCDGHSPCYTTIQAAITASDGGGDTIIVSPGAYLPFSVPADTQYNHLTIQGVSADAVFIDGGGLGDAISIAADGVHLSNLTVRNTKSGVTLQDGAGEPTWTGGEETNIDHLLAHSVQNPISISQNAALTLSDSTLVGNGADPILNVGSTRNSAVHTWHIDQEMTSDLLLNGGLASASGKLYAMAGGSDPTVYTATPGAEGELGTWTTAFRTPEEMPYTGDSVKRNVIAAGGGYFYQMHPYSGLPDLGSFNGVVRAVAVAPNGDIYAGGSFSVVGMTGANNIARWDGAQWNRLGSATSNGTNGPVYAITIVSNGDVYVGGQFSQALDGTAVPASNIARWNGSHWLTLGEAVLNGNGADGPVYALTHTGDGVVAVGGQFEYVRASLAGFNSGQFSSVRNFAVYDPTRWPGAAGWNWETNWAIGDYPIYESSSVNTLFWSGGNYQGAGTRFILGGSFSKAGMYTAKNIVEFICLGGMYGNYYRVQSMGNGVVVQVTDVAIDPTTADIFAVSNDPTSQGVYWWQNSTSTWSTKFGWSGAASALAVDARGIIYVGTVDGKFLVDKPFESARFEHLEQLSEGMRIWDILPESLIPDRSGQVLVARGSTTSSSGGIKYWELEGLFRRPLSGTNTNWQWVTYPIGFNHEILPDAVAADDSGNVYASQLWSSYSVLYRFNAGSRTWDLVASLSSYKDSDPTQQFTLTDLAWAHGYLYGLAYSSQDSGQKWYLYRYDPASPILSGSSDMGPSVNWTQVSLTPLPFGTSAVSSRSWAWDGADSIYVLQSSGVYRYRISANTWDGLEAPTISFTLSQKPAMAVAGPYLYVYATPGTGVTTNLFRYGAVGMPDVRLTVRNTALVEPDSATSSLAWTNLTLSGGTYRFQIDADTTNEWVGPFSATWAPTLPTGATTLTSVQTDFVAPEDDLYRVGAGSILKAGYHHYMALAHVYPSQAACTECANGSQTWGVDAFATLREAVESGAARVLVHPGRYPQTFYLVSGVEVIGSGAESTLLQPPPTGPTATLVTAEGVAHASLARVTLAGGALWQGFLAEGGAKGLKLSRTIIRDLMTGVNLSGDSQVELLNNTIVGNTDGVIIQDTTPVNVRNTIFAYNTGTGLTHGENPTSLSNTYNVFWSNRTDMIPEDVSIGSQFVDPHFRDLIGEDLRLAGDSPLIDMGSPNDPTTPGGGERVDIGYAEYNAAGFYVSQDYSETGLDDGLTWGIDAFSTIQAGLEAAAATLHGLQGAVPEGGYSVAVDAGAYTERVTVPSHVRLVGSGAAITTIDANAAGSAVTFDGAIDSELTGFTIQNASASGAGVELKNAANGITLERNVITGNAGHGISLTGGASLQVLFNTIVSNSNAGVYATGSGTWADVRNNILDGNGYSLQATSSGLIRNRYNLFYNNTHDPEGVTLGDGSLKADPAYTPSTYYVPSAGSPPIDAAEPWAEVPLAGGLRADLGYKELIASPLTLFFSPQIHSTVTGNSGVAKVEIAVVPVTDQTKSVTETAPTTWDYTMTPAQTGQPLYYWSQSMSETNAGLYRVYSRATDGDGNTEADANDWYDGSFVIDGTAPTLSWSINPSGAANAAAVLAAVDVTGVVNTDTGERSDVTQTYFSVTQGTSTLSYPAEDGQAWIPLPAAGSYSIKSVAVDEAGNQAQTSVATVTVGAGSSIATVTNPPQGAAISSPEVTLHGYVRFSGAGGGTVTVAAGGTNVQAALDSPGAAFSAWSAQVTLSPDEGAKSITITPSGGTAMTLTLTLDTTAPVLGMTSPATGATVLQTVPFSGTASDVGSQLARVEISVDGGYTWREAPITNGTWVLDWDLGLDRDYVTYPAQARAVDLAGNVALLERTVTVDNVPPTGLAPVTFDPPIGQHLEAGSDNLSVTWNTPVDASGTAQVLMAADHNEDVDENTLYTSMAGSTGAVSLNEAGDWYVHLLTQDAVGNHVITQYGPWHVRDMTNLTFSARQASIILDGNLDLQHAEWLATDLLGIDARSGHPQELYATWDGQYVYLGWSGAWWTLDGALWAYLDMVAGGGADTTVDGLIRLPAGLGADQAVEINGADDGSLWTWSGTAWVAAPLNSADFSNGQTGDTEVRMPRPASASPALNLVAFALPHEAEQGQAVQPQTLASGNGLMALAKGGANAHEDQGMAPWAIFPTTNPLGETITQGFAWTDVTGVTGINGGQPSARTVYMTVTSPQASEAAWCGGHEIVYDILLENPEATGFSGLTLTLNASSGLSYQGVEGASLTSGAPGDSSWTLNAPPLAAGASTHVVVTARLAAAAELPGSTMVNSTLSLSAGETELTPESHAETTVIHRVDGQAPAVGIDLLPGSAIAAGNSTFTGSADDDAGSGVARIEVSTDGTTWIPAEGTLAWSINLNTPNETTHFDLYARAIDQCGYSSTEERTTFVVDTTPPDVVWTPPAVVTSDLAPISGTASDPAPAGGLVQSVEVQLDSADGAWNAARLLPGQGWTWDWATPREDGVSHHLRVRATDAVGNTTPFDTTDPAGWPQLVVDNVAPQLSVAQTMTDPLVINALDGSVLTGNVSDGSGVQEVDILVSDPQGGVFTQKAAVTDGTWKYVPDLTAFTVGTYPLRVQAVDMYGNGTMQGPYPFEVTEEMLQHPGIAVSTVTAVGPAEGDGLTILTGEPISWKYTVTNTGNVSLGGVSVTDSVSGVNPAYVSGDANGDGKLDVDETWIYEASGMALADVYTNTGAASGTSPSGVPVNAQDGSSYFGAAPGFSVSLECKTDTEPIPQEGPAVFTVTFTNAGNVDLSITADGILSDGMNTLPTNTPFNLALGESASFETTVSGDFAGNPTVSNIIRATGAYTDSAGILWEDSANQQQASAFCRVGSRINLLKWTQGVPDPSMSWTFSLWAKANGFGGTPLASINTIGIADGLLDFGNLNLDRLQTYMVCEVSIPAGWTSFWQVDSNDNGVVEATDATLIPYNPNGADTPPQDVGNRCVDFGAGTGVELLTDGGALLFRVNNTYPGGEPRSAGYWKNWNQVTSDGQADNADRNGGYENGFWLVEDMLDPEIGGGIAWDDILADSFSFSITKTAVAVDILDQRELGDEDGVYDGPKHANDAAFTLAMQLLAAQLNIGAGARTCDAAFDAALAGEQLLDLYDFNGTGAYLVSNNKKTKNDYHQALQLASTLDQYNNNMLCTGPAVSFVTPLEGAKLAGEQTLQVTIIDTVPILQVEFFADGVSIGVDHEPADGWLMGWDSTGINEGSHTLMAVATNSMAQTGSADVTVSVDNIGDPPAVSLISPVEGVTVRGSSVEITADCSSPVGLKQVEFFANDALIDTDTDGSDGWSATWDLTGVADGLYTIAATATANDEQVADDNLSVTVDNVQDIPFSDVGLDSSSVWTKPNVSWEATIIVTLESQLEGASLTGSWSTGATGACTSGADGRCAIVLSGINKKVGSVTFSVADIIKVGYIYTPSIVASVTVDKPH